MFLVGLLLLISYLVGSIPTGYWIVKFYSGIDLSTVGSKNIGATNAARVLKNGIMWFFVILLIDALKAYLVLYFFDHILTLYSPATNTNNLLIIFAFSLLICNAHSVFLRLKG